MLRILALGDVVGEEGVRLLESGGRLRRMIGERRADLTIVNGENSAEGNGISKESAERLLDAGADVLTGGNHTWRRRDVYRLLDDGEALIRPANYPPDAPGVGYLIAEARGYRVLVLNLIGTVYMEPVTPPADTASRILKNERGNYDFAVCDFHAEATSEKLFLVRYFDGKFAALFGTHTHVQTADEQILPGGTGYITDLGMCGSTAGILGVKTESIVHKFTLRTPVQFEPAHGSPRIRGCLFEIDEKTGKCVRVERIDEE